jgi:two-component system, OmpR family, alkaline phosphatase synthesis response regulator PhoP
MYKVMIVDDERDIVDGLAMNLEREGYCVLKAYDGTAALQIANQENPHIILLDVMMPGLSGLDVCRELRRREIDTRIIMLSAKGEELDRVVGLEVGADDYVSKPFKIRELLALIRARLRYRTPGSSEYVPRCQFADVQVDFETHTATKSGVPVKLTSKEMDLLHFMVQRRGIVLTRDQILDKLWGQDRYTTARTVDNHVLRLRKKLEPDPADPKYILSVYGGGYKFIG